MELKEIKKINQRIYELDEKITRSNKTIFISTLLFCLTRNKDFQDATKLTTLINFASQTPPPIDQIIDLAKEEIKKLNLKTNVEQAIFNSLNTISGVNTSLDKNRNEFRDFILYFIEKFSTIKPEDLFLETLYMAIDKKANANDKGIVLTPIFAAQLMVELANIDYKKDVVIDLCSGTGLFSLLSYSKMLNDLNKDYKNNNISWNDKQLYEKKIYNSIIANDNEPKMVTLCLANFLLKTLNHNFIYYENVLNLNKSNFKDSQNNTIQATKAILNPPYEDKYKPLEILEKVITLVKNENSNIENKVVVIIPSQKFGMKKDVFARILNISTLELVIRMQDNLFIDSNTAQSASILVFNANKNHNKNDVIKYYNFTDTGYVYLKDSGLVDKDNTYKDKKRNLLERINSKTIKPNSNEFVRSWTNFYEINKELELETKIDPLKVKTNKQEADITIENISIKKMLIEKQNLMDSVDNNFKDLDGSFEKYIIDILSEE
ncbi:SAM-dependent DNA methyltransferase [Metamycoplasma hominis]|uniref:SAM-dependent DNA methyltransferase n=1 Tax=Metamycoplasma hominis TaxID=2098 RepID=UPI0019399FB2|nr:SAM-dependent DNA methyltransferase [Metamycoplasma hominis]